MTEKKKNNKNVDICILNRHYEYMLIQKYWKFYHPKKWKFSDKTFWYFFSSISAQSIDLGTR